MFKELVELTEGFKKEGEKSCKIPVYVVSKSHAKINVCKYIVTSINKDKYRGITLILIKENSRIPQELARFSSSDEVIRVSIDDFINGRTWGYHDVLTFFFETKPQAENKAKQLKEELIKIVKNNIASSKKETKRLEKLLSTIKENKNASNS